MKVANVRRVVDTISFLVNARILQLECANVLHEALLVPVLMFGSVAMAWEEKGLYKETEWYRCWCQQLYDAPMGWRFS